MNTESELLLLASGSMHRWCVLKSIRTFSLPIGRSILHNVTKCLRRLTSGPLEGAQVMQAQSAAGGARAALLAGHAPCGCP